MRLTLRAAYRSWEENEQLALELAVSSQALAQHTEDYEAAVEAIPNKARPKFEGR